MHRSLIEFLRGAFLAVGFDRRMDVGFNLLLRYPARLSRLLDSALGSSQARFPSGFRVGSARSGVFFVGRSAPIER
jgi:hypothetical protein